MAAEGAKGLSHPKVDRYAEVPNGSTSFYFRTRSALLRAAAERLAELDLADLMSVADPIDSDDSSDSVDASRLATMVMLSAEEPRLTRTKARFELILQANRDPDLAEAFRHNSEVFTELHRREIMSRSTSKDDPDQKVLDEQTAATMSFVSGVHMSFIAGDRHITSAAQLDLLLIGIADGIAAAYQSRGAKAPR
ncbi:MAG: TetR/AcrR family transcriptional regulator [Mycobacterium sp.]